MTFYQWLFQISDGGYGDNQKQETRLGLWFFCSLVFSAMISVSGHKHYKYWIGAVPRGLLLVHVY